eukprot:COSAG01_NODE_52653_length_345_cov_0.703252_1_plen_30_part_10
MLAAPNTALGKRYSSSRSAEKAAAEHQQQI